MIAIFMIELYGDTSVERSLSPSADFAGRFLEALIEESELQFEALDVKISNKQFGKRRRCKRLEATA
jgi:hypothetical protein